MEEHARQATVDDLPIVVALAAEAHAEIGASKGGAMWARREARQPPLGASLQAGIDDESQLTILGTLDDSGVGYATVTTELLPDGALIAEVTEIFVLPDGRGVGVGEAMLDAVMDWARDLGCTHLEGSVLPGNRAGKNFFERAHMVTRILRVSTPLDG